MFNFKNNNIMYKKYLDEKPTGQKDYHLVMYNGDRASGKWNGERFTDKDGEDFTELDKNVKWWFDIDCVAHPELSIEIDGKEIPLQKPLFDLIKATSKERDTYKLIVGN